MILVVALVAVAASAAAPAYYSASQASILRDNLSSVPVLGRGYEVTQYGSVATTLGQMQSELAGPTRSIRTWFQPPTRAIQATQGRVEQGR